MRILICGLGSMGRRHYNNLSNSPIIKVDRGPLAGSPARLDLYAYRTNKSTLKDDFNFKKVFYNFDDIREHTHIDGVIISNPTSLHVATASRLKDLMCPFFIEKPLSDTLDGVNMLESHFGDKNIPCMLGYHVLFHPCFLKLEELVCDGTIGEIVSCKAYNGSYLPNWHPWEDYKKSYASNRSLGGGVTLTMIHELNYLTRLFGTPQDYYGMKTEKNTLGIDVDEGMEILLKHDSGVVSNIHLNFFQQKTERWLKITGTKGTLYWDFWSSEIVVNDKIIEFEESPLELLNKSYLDEICHFLAICSGKLGARPVQQILGTTLTDGIEDVKIATTLLEKAI